MSQFKHLLYFTLFFALFSCNKDEELPRNKFLGTWSATNTVTKIKSVSKITEGKKNNLMLWSINGETIELELIGKNDSIAFAKSLSVPFFGENFASLTFYANDSLEGSRSKGSIFLPNYKSDRYLLTR